MIRQELQDYIKNSKDAGLSDEQIKNELAKTGWQKEEIDENFSVPNSTPASSSTTIDYPQLDTKYKETTTTFNQKPKRNLKRILLKIFVIFIGFIFIFAAFIYFFPKIANVLTSDIAPPDDSDLQLSKVQIANSENSYFDLVKLEGNIVEKIGGKNLIDDIVTNKIWDQAYVDELLKQNEKVLAYFDQAATKQNFQDPEVADPKNISPNMKIMSMYSAREIAKISSIKAANLTKRGKIQEALDESIKVVKIGYEIQNSQGMLIHYLVGIAIEKSGFDRIQQIIQSTNLSPEVLILYSKKINSFKNHTEGLKNAFKAEYTNITYTTDNFLSLSPEDMESMGITQTQLDSIKQGGYYYFRPNMTKALYADLARAWIKDTDCSSNTSEVELLINRYGLKLENPIPIVPVIKLFFTENAIGKILFQIVGTSFSSVTVKACNENLNSSATQTLMALKAYKFQTGSYPPTLEALITTYFPELPKDPYTNLPLKYSLDKKIIYSVGLDRKDDGGSQGDDWTKMPDPTFKINF